MRWFEINAIMVRSYKLFLADKSTLVASLIWPLLLIFVIGLGFDSFVNFENIGMSYTEFLGPGIIAYFAMASAMVVGNTFISDRDTVIKELLVAPISRYSIFVGLILGSLVLTVGLMIIISIIFLELIDLLTLSSVFGGVLFMILISFVFYGGSLIISFFAKKVVVYQQFVAFLAWFVVLSSGMLFPITNLPAWLKIISMINPLTYGVDGLRGVMIGVSEYSILTSVVVLLGWGFMMTIIGAWFFRRSVEVI